MKKRIFVIFLGSIFILFIAMYLGLVFGVGQISFNIFQNADETLKSIIWKLRLPRVLLAALTGTSLSMGGLVFQSLLKNPLAEPYILGISGGAAIGAITGILLGFSGFPSINIFAFIGSVSTLFVIIILCYGNKLLRESSILLAGVMINAFCSAIITFLISLTQDSRLHNILFWLMGDFSSPNFTQVLILTSCLLPCFGLIFMFSHSMNLLVMGNEIAQSMGINIKLVILSLLIISSFMISSTVCYCGLLGFVGLVVPHLLRLLLGSDHKILIPACLMGGAYLVICDIIARMLSKQSEMPVGVITAIIGAPLFVYLVRKA